MRSMLPGGNRLIVVLWLILATIGVSATADDSRTWPTAHQLTEAMKKAVAEPFPEGGQIWIRSIHEISVGPREDALLISASLPDRPRNDTSRVFLFRPKLKKAIELPYSRVVESIHVYGHYGRFVLLEQYSSGTGEEDYIHSLVQFEGWKVSELHRVHFENNLGRDCAYDGKCHQGWVKFQLLPGANDDLDLIEWTVQSNGKVPMENSLQLRTKRFRFVVDRFVEIDN